MCEFQNSFAALWGNTKEIVRWRDLTFAMDNSIKIRLYCTGWSVWPIFQTLDQWYPGGVPELEISFLSGVVYVKIDGAITSWNDSAKGRGKRRGS